jgi:SAM-dependent methyltransferase
LAPAAAAGIATQSQPAEAVPLAERALADVEPPAPVEDPPADNRAGWNAISKAYQDAYDDYLGAALMWSWTVSEDDVHLLDDVRGKHVIVLGCGGGQDVIALCEMGAVATGIDQSDEQIAFARKLAVKRGADNASFAVGTVEDLSRFDDESFDAAVSAHMLNYVERIDDTLRETARVLRPASVFALSVRHPFDAIVAKDAPFGLERAYWETRHDWTWDFDSGASGNFTQWLWTIEQWFDMLGAAGFAIERVLELREELPDTRHDHAARSRMIPYTLAIKARKR